MSAMMSVTHQALFCATYALYPVANSVFFPLSPVMQKDIGFTSGDAASIAAWGTVGHAVGKAVFGGWAVDIFGARRCVNSVSDILEDDVH